MWGDTMFKIMNKLLNKIKKSFCESIERSIIESINFQEILKKSAEITRTEIENDLNNLKKCK